jgi:hypothetical protein
MIFIISFFRKFICRSFKGTFWISVKVNVRAMYIRYLTVNFPFARVNNILYDFLGKLFSTTILLFTKFFLLHGGVGRLQISLSRVCSSFSLPPCGHVNKNGMGNLP